MSRLQNRFAELKAENRAALVTFITAGDPDYATSLSILKGLPDAGADVIELGMPFTDPMADGPAIQLANIRALAGKQGMQQTLQMVREFREGNQSTPLVLMGYYNPIFVYGVERFISDAKEAGVDGLILVCAGAGGHAGTLSPFALLAEVRRIYDGPVALAGAIATGDAILAAQALGADFAYMGTRFIATEEANASSSYKEMISAASASDILYSSFFTGVPGNYLKPSIVASGLDPEALPSLDKSSMNFGTAKVKPWRNIWGAGQGVGAITDAPPVAEVVERLSREYRDALARLSRVAATFPV